MADAMHCDREGCDTSMTEHLPIQRWQKIFTRYPASEVLPNENGEYVTYADHLAALRACERRMLDAAREAVKHLQHSDDCYYAEGVLCHCEIKRVITAIDALREEKP